MMNSLKVKIVFGVAVCLFAAAAVAAEQKPGTQVSKSMKVQINENGAKTEVEVRYLQFLPSQYRSDGEPLPVILFLHGAGERGSDLELVKKWGPPRIVEKEKGFPFVVISPQCPLEQHWDTRLLLPLLDRAVKTLHVDTNRIYVTGLSMGGAGTWAMIAAAPQRFAAAMPLCGPGDPQQAAQYAKLPIWAVQGGRDRASTVAKMKETVGAIRAAGGKNVKLTMYEDLGHNVWSRTYSDPATFAWLLSKKRSSGGN